MDQGHSFTVRCFAGAGRRLALTTTLVFIAVLAVVAGPASATIQVIPTTSCGYDNSGYQAVYACGSNVYATAGTQFSGQVATFTLTPTGQETGVTLNSATITWGDGTTTSTSDGTGDVTIDNSDGTISGSNTYASPGLYPVTIVGNGCTSDNSICGSVDVDGTASVDSPGETTPAQISINLAPDSPADGKYTVTAQAQDGSGNVLTGYNDAAPTWTDTDSALGSQTPTAFVNGVSTTSGVDLPVGDQVSVTSGGVTGTSAAVTAPDKFVIGLTSPRTAGQPFTLTIRAETPAGKIVTSYNGSPTWSDTRGELTGSPASFVKGISTNQVTFANPARNDKVTVTDSGLAITGTSGTFSVIGPLSRFVIGPAATRTAGQPFPLTLRAEDAAGNTITSYAGTPTWSDTSGQLTGSPAAFTNGVSTNQVTFAYAVNHDQLTVADSAQNISDQSAVFNVSLPPSTCNFDNSGGNVVELCGTKFNTTVGTSFGGRVATYVIDSEGQQDGVTVNSATINWGDGTPASDGTVNGNSTGGTISGPHTYTSPGTYTVTIDATGCTSDNSICGSAESTTSAVVKPPPASISVDASPDSSGDGDYTITAEALDGSGNITTSYNDPSPSWSDTRSELGSQTPAAFVDGVSTTTGVALPTPETSDRISVTSDGLKGTSASFAVIGPLSKFLIKPSPGPETAGQPFTVTVTAQDAVGNTITYYAGTPTWSDTSGQLTGSPAAFSDGVSTNQVTLDDPYTNDHITVTDGSVSTQGFRFNVNSASAAN